MRRRKFTHIEVRTHSQIHKHARRLVNMQKIGKIATGDTFQTPQYSALIKQDCEIAINSLLSIKMPLISHFDHSLKGPYHGKPNFPLFFL